LATREQILQDCAEDLLTFGKVISPQTFYKKSPPFHYELADYLMNRDIKQLCIEAPRGFAKSSLSTMFILHHITFDKGDKFVVVQSKTAGEAINRLTKIKEVLSSPVYWQLTGNEIHEKTAIMWRENKIKLYINGFMVTIKAIGTGMQVRGALESDTRITLYLLDDPEDELNCKTEDSMNANFRVFLGGLPGLDSRNGRAIVIGTPVHELCIVERLKTMKNWTFKWYEACDNNFENLLWADYRSSEWLKDQYESLSSAGQRRIFYAEYRCTLIPGEDQIFKPADFRYWDGELEIIGGETFLKITSLHKVKLPEPILKPVNVFQGYDPASSTKQSADYSVRFSIAFDTDRNIYCLPYFRKRVQPMDFGEEMISSIKTEKPKRGHIESVAYQEMLRQYVKQRLEEEGIYLAGLETKFNPRTEKSARLETLQPFFASHKVFLKEGMSEFEDELTMYPRSKHDDLIDGFFYATRKLYPPYHEVPKEKQYTDDELMQFYRNAKKKNEFAESWKTA
jgi:predicted phage terminase large subunit-like protein